MTGELFDGRKAAEMGLVNEAVPKEELRERVRELADVLLQNSPEVLKAAKDAFKRMQQMDWDMSEEYLISKQEQLWFVAGEEREEGIQQFLNDRTLSWILGCIRDHPGNNFMHHLVIYELVSIAFKPSSSPWRMLVVRARQNTASNSDPLQAIRNC